MVLFCKALGSGDVSLVNRESGWCGGIREEREAHSEVRGEPTDIWSQEALGLAISCAEPQLYQAIRSLKQPWRRRKRGSEPGERFPKAPALRAGPAPWWPCSVSPASGGGGHPGWAGCPVRGAVGMGKGKRGSPGRPLPLRRLIEAMLTEAAWRLRTRGLGLAAGPGHAARPSLAVIPAPCDFALHAPCGASGPPSWLVSISCA